ncbi:MAG TPA: P-type conjugative transfer protein TrbG [Oligoflexia bacterium]|nr:P-type conjugative transfer protein TrbG [Oligoflexia bacterium]HMP49140.1 P-type conjugative transfer protein TrbG [Oligoflexia bacterium]
MRLYLFLFAVILSSKAFASDPIPEEEVTAEEVKSAMAEAEKEFAEALAKRDGLDSSQKISPYLKTSANFETLKVKNKSTLEELAAQVDALKNKIIVEKSTILATQSPKKVKVHGHNTIFNYNKSSLYEVTAAVDHITDIALKEGENLTTPPTAGDTVRWHLSVMKSGTGDTGQTHIIVKPLDEEIETNLIITTDQNVYHIKLKSGDFHMPSVSWNYPQDVKLLMEASLRKENSQEATIRPDQLSFNYSIEGEDYNWKPVRVFDDGQKTFIQMPKNFRVTEAPVLFLLDDESNPMIVNYRVKGDLYILDRLIEHVELRVGVDKSITITLDDGRNFFERLFY